MGKMPSWTYVLWVVKATREDKDPALTGRPSILVRSFVHAALLEEAFGFSQKTNNEEKDGGRRDQIG